MLLRILVFSINHLILLIDMFTVILKYYSLDKGTILLRTELNFVKLQHHRPEQIYSNWYDSIFTVIDEIFTFGFLEFALKCQHIILILMKKPHLIFLSHRCIGLGNNGYWNHKQINDNPLVMTHLMDYYNGICTTNKFKCWYIILLYNQLVCCDYFTYSITITL